MPVLLLLLASRVFAQAAVPMHLEPRHRLVLTHQHVRVMDVQIPPGDTTDFHVHDRPALYVAVSTAPVDIQLLGGAWGGTHPAADPGRKPGDVNVDTSYVGHPITHRVTNVGSQLFNLIAVTTSTASPSEASAPDMPGGLEHQSRWFAQSRVELGAGTVQRWYVATSPTIIVQPLAGVATVTVESGETRELKAAGSWALVREGARYRLSSADTATLVVIQVR